MAKRKFTPTERSILYKQVNGICPLDNKPFESKKTNGLTTYVFDCAHIYPENPSAADKELLKNENLLSDNVNDLNNIIALSPSSHRKYDSNKTIDEYKRLYNIKKQAILQANIDSFLSYPLEQELFIAAKKLYEIKLDDETLKLNYESLKVSAKLSSKKDIILMQKIELYVRQYYLYLQNIFKSRELLDQKFNLICSQIKSFYLKVKEETADKSLIFSSVSNWFENNNVTKDKNAMDVLTSFFVQNCEIFEAGETYVTE